MFKKQSKIDFNLLYSQSFVSIRFKRMPKIQQFAHYSITLSKDIHNQ